MSNEVEKPQLVPEGPPTPLETTGHLEMPQVSEEVQQAGVKVVHPTGPIGSVAEEEKIGVKVTGDAALAEKVSGQIQFLASKKESKDIGNSSHWLIGFFQRLYEKLMFKKERS